MTKRELHRVDDRVDDAMSMTKRELHRVDHRVDDRVDDQA